MAGANEGIGSNAASLTRIEGFRVEYIGKEDIMGLASPSFETASTKSVIHAAAFSPVYSGNFIASLRAAAAECRRLGIRPVWVFPEEAKARDWFSQFCAETEAACYVLPRRKGHLKYAVELAHIARKENAAIIHTHFSRYDIAAWLAKAICALDGKRVEVIWHVHSAFPPRTNCVRLAMDVVKLALMGRACHMVPVCEDLGRSLVRRGCPAGSIHLVSNGIDIAHATQKSSAPAEVRRDLMISDDSVVLLGFGWQPIRKGVDTMLEALDDLIQGGMKAVLVLVGTNDDLKHYVDKWPSPSLKSSVRVVGGTEFVSDLYRAADVFISASRYEGWCYSVAEAMLNDIPVASTDIPALSWAADAPGVFFFKPGDGPALAQVIRRVARMSDHDRRETSELGRTFVSDRYSAQRWAQSITSLYEELLRCDGTRARFPTRERTL